MTSFFDDKTLPVDFDGSCNPAQLPSMDLGETLQLVTKTSNGRMSPVRARSMKDYDQQISELRKENFSLKLRIFFLEERMQKKVDGDADSVFKINIDLKVEVESLKKEMMQKQELLQKASNALESVCANHQMELQQARSEGADEVALAEAQQTTQHLAELQGQLEERDMEVAAERQRVQDCSLKMKEVMLAHDQLRQQYRLLEEQVAEGSAPNDGGSFVRELEDKGRETEGLRQLVNSKELIIENLEEEKKDVERRLQRDLDRKSQEVESFRSEMHLMREQLNNAQLAVPDTSAIEKTLQDEIIRLKKRVEELDKLNATHMDNQLKRDKAIQGLVSVVHDRENQLGDKDEELEQVRQQLQHHMEVSEQRHKDQSGAEQKTAELQAALSSAEQEKTRLSKNLVRREAEVSRLTTELEKLDGSLQGNEDHLQDVREALQEEKHRSMQKIESMDSHYQTLLDDQHRRVSAQEKLVQRLTKSLQDKELQLQAQEQQQPAKDVRDSLVHSLREQLRQKESALEEAHEDKYRALEGKDSEIQQLKRVMREREYDVARANQMLLTAESTIDSLNSEITAKDVTIRQLNAAARSHQKSLEGEDVDRKQEQQALNKNIQTLQADLHQKDLELQSQDGRLRRSTEQQQQHLEQLRSALTDKDKTIEALVEGNHEKEQLYQQAKSTSSNGDPNSGDGFGKLGNMADLQSLEDEVNRLHEQLRYKDSEVEHLQAAVDRHNPLVDTRTHHMLSETEGELRKRTETDLLQQMEKDRVSHRQEMDKLRNEMAHLKEGRKTNSPSQRHHSGELESHEAENLRREVHNLRLEVDSHTTSHRKSPPASAAAQEVHNLATLINTELNIYRQINHGSNSSLGAQGSLIQVELGAIQLLRQQLQASVERNQEKSHRHVPDSLENTSATHTYSPTEERRDRDSSGDALQHSVASVNLYPYSPEGAAEDSSSISTPSHSQGKSGIPTLQRGSSGSRRPVGSTVSNGTAAGRPPSGVVTALYKTGDDKQSDLTQAQTQITILHEKLASCESTIHKQTNQVRQYRQILDEAGLLPSNTVRSRSENNLSMSSVPSSTGEHYTFGSGSMDNLDGDNLFDSGHHMSAASSEQNVAQFASFGRTDNVAELQDQVKQLKVQIKHYEHSMAHLHGPRSRSLSDLQQQRSRSHSGSVSVDDLDQVGKCVGAGSRIPVPVHKDKLVAEKPPSQEMVNQLQQQVENMKKQLSKGGAGRRVHLDEERTLCDTMHGQMVELGGALDELLHQDEEGEVDFIDVTSERVTQLKQLVEDSTIMLSQLHGCLDEEALDAGPMSKGSAPGGSVANTYLQQRVKQLEEKLVKYEGLDSASEDSQVLRELESLSEQKQRLEEEGLEMRSAMVDCKHTMQILEAERSRLQTNISTQQTQIDKLQDELFEQSEKMAAVEQDRDRMKEENIRLSVEVNEQKTAISRLQGTIDRLQTRLDTKQREEQQSQGKSQQSQSNERESTNLSSRHSSSQSDYGLTPERVRHGDAPVFMPSMSAGSAYSLDFGKYLQPAGPSRPSDIYEDVMMPEHSHLFGTTFAGSDETRIVDTSAYHDAPPQLVIEHLQSQLIAAQDHNTTLREEVAVYEGLRHSVGIQNSPNVTANQSQTLNLSEEEPVTPPGQQTGVTAAQFAEHLEQIQALRKKLEETLYRNDQLRDKLLTQAGAKNSESVTNLYVNDITDTTTISTQWKKEILSLKEQLSSQNTDIGRLQKELNEAKQDHNTHAKQQQEELEAAQRNHATRAAQQRAEFETAQRSHATICSKLQAQLDSKERELASVRSTERRHTEEVTRLQDQLKERSDLNQTLRLEISMLDRMNDTTSSTGGRKSGSGSSGQLDLRLLMEEIRLLRSALERTIKNNDDLRQKLEELLQGSGGATHTSHLNIHHSSTTRGATVSTDMLAREGPAGKDSATAHSSKHSSFKDLSSNSNSLLSNASVPAPTLTYSQPSSLSATRPQYENSPTLLDTSLHRPAMYNTESHLCSERSPSENFPFGEHSINGLHHPSTGGDRVNAGFSSSYRHAQSHKHLASLGLHPTKYGLPSSSSAALLDTKKHSYDVMSDFNKRYKARQLSENSGDGVRSFLPDSSLNYQTNYNTSALDKYENSGDMDTKHNYSSRYSGHSSSLLSNNTLFPWQPSDAHHASVSCSGGGLLSGHKDSIDNLEFTNVTGVSDYWDSTRYSIHDPQRPPDGADVSPEVPVRDSAQSHQKVGSDLRSLYAIGELDDYELLKKRLNESCTLLAVIHAQLRTRLKTFNSFSTLESVEYSVLRETSSGVGELDNIFHDLQRLIALFWVSQLPPRDIHGHYSDPRIVKENQLLKQKSNMWKNKFLEARTSMAAAAERLKVQNDFNEKNGSSVVMQLQETHNVIQKARHNLERRCDPSNTR